MYVYSSQIELAAEGGLGGYGNTTATACNKGGSLEIHGFGFNDFRSNSNYEVCSIDALYAGELAHHQSGNVSRRILAASHTHLAPMLDKDKPSLGLYSDTAVQKFSNAINTADRRTICPDKCIIMKGEVKIPVYRRFDFPASLSNRILTRYAGAFPNSAHPVDRGVYLFMFRKGTSNLFCIAYCPWA